MWPLKRMSKIGFIAQTVLLYRIKGFLNMNFYPPPPTKTQTQYSYLLFIQCHLLYIFSHANYGFRVANAYN